MRRKIRQLGQVNVDRGVLDPEGEGIIHHLNLKALLARGGGKCLGELGDVPDVLDKVE